MLLRDKQLHVMSVFVGLLPITKERDKELKERERERERWAYIVAYTQRDREIGMPTLPPKTKERKRDLKRERDGNTLLPITRERGRRVYIATYSQRDS